MSTPTKNPQPPAKTPAPRPYRGAGPPALGPRKSRVRPGPRTRFGRTAAPRRAPAAADPSPERAVRDAAPAVRLAQPLRAARGTLPRPRPTTREGRRAGKCSPPAPLSLQPRARSPSAGGREHPLGSAHAGGHETRIRTPSGPAADRSWFGKWDGDPLRTQARRGPSGTQERDRYGGHSRTWGKRREGPFRIAGRRVGGTFGSRITGRGRRGAQESSPL